MRTYLSTALALPLAAATFCGQILAGDFTEEQLAKRTIERRAVEAVIWGMPLVNTDAMRQAYLRDVGAKYNDICYFSKPADWRFQVTTPNASTNYVYFNVNLKDGPVVVDIPAAEGAGLVGCFVDAWDSPMTDVGPSGADAGKGGKYLLLPPDFKGEPPSGYLPVPSVSYNNYALLRAIKEGAGPQAEAAALSLVKKLRVYPLAQASTPPAQQYIDIYSKTFNGVAVLDDTFFDSLARMVEEEPVQPHDLAVMGQLKSVGIEKGKPFNPDAETRKALKAAAQEAQALFMSWQKSYSQPWWPDLGWSTPDATGLKSGWTYIGPSRVDLDQRASFNFQAFAPPRKLGEASVYLFATKDDKGAVLRGENHYVLRVPANVPAKQYWSFTMYDEVTSAFIRESPVVTLDSYNQALKKNADGSVDLYIGPKPPAGKESNWIYTKPGHGWYPLFRLYGPEKPFLDKQWKLPNIEKVK